MESIKLTPTCVENIISRIHPIPFTYQTDYNINLINTTSSSEIVLAIPFGKKYCIYFSYYNEHNVCYLMELNKNKSVIRVTVINVTCDSELHIGTLLYGTCVPVNTLQYNGQIIYQENDDRILFIIEDIYLWKGISMTDILYNKRIGYIKSLFEKYNLKQDNSKIIFYFTNMWYVPIHTFSKYEIEEKVQLSYYLIKHSIIYPVHHLQMRNININNPYLNIQIGISTISNPKECTYHIHVCEYIHNYSKPIYKTNAIFMIKLSKKYDIYYLYCKNDANEDVFYGFAGIPDIKTSVFMNLFIRNLKENINLDFIQESDDENEDVEMNNTETYIYMMCNFNFKIKKWVPIQHVLLKPTLQIVQLKDLVNLSNHNHNNNVKYNTHKPISKKMK